MRGPEECCTLSFVHVGISTPLNLVYLGVPTRLNNAPLVLYHARMGWVSCWALLELGGAMLLLEAILCGLNWQGIRTARRKRTTQKIA